MTATFTGPASVCPDPGAGVEVTVHGGAGGTRATLEDLRRAADALRRTAEELASADRCVPAVIGVVDDARRWSPATAPAAEDACAALLSRRDGLGATATRARAAADALDRAADAYADADGRVAAALRAGVMTSAHAFGEAGPFAWGALGGVALLLAGRSVVSGLLSRVPTPLGMAHRGIGAATQSRNPAVRALAWAFGGGGRMPGVPDARGLERSVDPFAAWLLGALPGPSDVRPLIHGEGLGSAPTSRVAALLLGGSRLVAAAAGHQRGDLVVTPSLRRHPAPGPGTTATPDGRPRRAVMEDAVGGAASWGASGGAAGGASRGASDGASGAGSGAGSSAGPVTSAGAAPPSGAAASAGTWTAADIVARIADLYPDGSTHGALGDVEVTRVERPDGTVSWIAVTPGTSDWSLLPGSDPNDTTSSLELFTRGAALSPEDAAAARADATGTLVQALELAGVEPGEPVVVVGHSLGGLAAMDLASDPSLARFDVQAVITVGSPVAGIDIPDHVQALHVETSHDVVPVLDGRPNPDVPNRTTVTVDLTAGRFAGTPLDPVSAHSVDTYTDALGALGEVADPSVQHFEQQLSEILGGPDSTSTTSWYTGARVRDVAGGVR
ncbi:hypothetical protein [Cellulomonas carbonis]|uniref:Fungal lipase-like domain-containing protein n=1 Tax=Cellulomonas carbonis T26 TaxID=947969 RepID=A0A0A0BV64_9CELL|nr:hypothetical protein [Cellulomonas carbonis]KGM11592.1 hypothetical protein N868_05350 [Cellulomonas carbonis T26]GGC06643.1 hypothetical protein GCM10010972_19840 [Cellulomonas carbonis]